MKRRFDKQNKLLRTLLKVITVIYIVLFLLSLNGILNNENHKKEVKNGRATVAKFRSSELLLHQGVNKIGEKGKIEGVKILKKENL